jgi:hypothetical protein
MTVTRSSVATGPAVPAAPPSPRGIRSPRRRWRDPRLLTGVLLVMASALGMAWVMGASDDTVPVWSVQQDVPAGGALTIGDLTVVSVQLPAASPYLSATEPVPEGAVAARDFAAGELLTAVGIDAPGAQNSERVVTMPVLRNQMPADLGVGDRVDVYVVERGSAGEPDGPPRLVMRSAIVDDVDDDGGAFGGTSLEAGVALSVSADEVAALVGAQARGTVTLVDVPVGSS